MTTSSYVPVFGPSERSAMRSAVRGLRAERWMLRMPASWAPRPPHTALCEIDTCGENRDGTPWPAVTVKYRDDGTPVSVCTCHADGWDD